MTSAYEDSLTFYVDELDLNFNGHMFQSANGHREIKVRPTLFNLISNQEQQLCVKPVSGQLTQ